MEQMDASAVADAGKGGASSSAGAGNGGAAPLDSAGTLSAQEAAQFQPPDDAPPSCEVEESDRLCVACLRKEACMIAAPCVHECLCGECARAVMRTNPRCPLCHTPIEGFTPRTPAAARRTHAEMLAEQQQQELHVTVASSAIVVCCTLYWSACAVFKTHDPYCAYVIVGILCICSNIEHMFLRAVTEEEEEEEEEETVESVDCSAGTASEEGKERERQRLPKQAPTTPLPPLQQKDVLTIIVRVVLRTLVFWIVCWIAGYSYAMLHTVVGGAGAGGGCKKGGEGAGVCKKGAGAGGSLSHRRKSRGDL